MKNEFIITIGSSHIAHDLKLIKSCLLYTDRIYVCSPLGNLFTSLNTIRSQADSTKFEDKLKIFDSIIKHNIVKPDYAVFMNAIDQLKTVKHKTKDLIILKKKLEREVEKVWNEFRKNDFEFSSGDKINIILSLYEKNILDYYFFEIKDRENIREELSNQFEKYITQSMSDPNSYVLLDDFTGKEFPQLFSSGKHSLTDTDKKRGNEVTLASSLFERLPRFDTASIEEILDIKKELHKHLVNFRSGMMKLTENINSAQWDSEFEKEV